MSDPEKVPVVIVPDHATVARMADRRTAQVVRHRRTAILEHPSQKDETSFPGSDERELRQPAEDPDRGTVRHLEALGPPARCDMEAYVVEGEGERLDPVRVPAVPSGGG